MPAARISHTNKNLSEDKCEICGLHYWEWSLKWFTGPWLKKAADELGGCFEKFIKDVITVGNDRFMTRRTKPYLICTDCKRAIVNANLCQWDGGYSTEEVKK